MRMSIPRYTLTHVVAEDLSNLLGPPELVARDLPCKLNRGDDILQNNAPLRNACTRLPEPWRAQASSVPIRNADILSCMKIGKTHGRHE